MDFEPKDTVSVSNLSPMRAHMRYSKQTRRDGASAFTSLIFCRKGGMCDRIQMIENIAEDFLYQSASDRGLRLVAHYCGLKHSQEATDVISEFVGGCIKVVPHRCMSKSTLSRRSGRHGIWQCQCKCPGTCLGLGASSSFETLTIDWSSTLTIVDSMRHRGLLSSKRRSTH